MAHHSLSHQVLEKALELAAGPGGEVDCEDVVAAMLVQTRVKRKRVLNILSEHAREGRLYRHRQGIYGPIPHGEKTPDKREVMWRLLRMRRKVKAADLVELAEVSESYAREWLQMLLRREVVRKVSGPRDVGVYVLVNDALNPPVDDKRAARLRKMRQDRAEMLNHLQAIDQAVSSVKKLVEAMEE